MKIRLERVSRDEIAAAACAWAGCEETYPVGKGGDSVASPPEGWRLLVVAKGSLFNPRNLLNADVDGSLCPKHFKLLLSLLKIGRVKHMIEKGQVEK